MKFTVYETQKKKRLVTIKHDKLAYQTIAAPDVTTEAEHKRVIKGLFLIIEITNERNRNDGGNNSSFSNLV